MNKQMVLIGCFLLSYIIGSIPTAYILVKIIKNQDIRKIGSGNVGATNASRILGKPAVFFILGVDILKGIIPVVFIGDYILFRFNFLYPNILRLILGLLAIIGHDWSIFLNFKGGKGVATTFGVLIGLALEVEGIWKVLIFCAGTWMISLLLSRMVSFASISTALFFPVFMFIFNQRKEFIFISIILSIFIILKHISNIKRILKKKEPRI
ncbi:MAG: glycerol-3-phosphate 1-O-acyltransferase PlsY [Candidatus Omnitrophica bacterium]|nr:glycerol-3-phosphate 1-O-acyltransferase PlsY [Candidatus Omnitrophota bacterium]